MKRRISSRLLKLGIGSFSEYLAYLKKSPDEMQELVDNLTVNVTHFFRDYDVYQSFGRNVIEPLMEKKNRIKLLSAGAASGQEAYSIAMLTKEVAEKKKYAGAFDIRGYDIDRMSLQKAREGIFLEDALKETPAEYKRKYFTTQESEKAFRKVIKISDEMRGKVRFIQKDLLKESLNGPFDAIFFRNVMIYFNRDLQEVFLSKLVDNLSKNGYLILGKTETLQSMEVKDRLDVVDIKTRIFQKID